MRNGQTEERMSDEAIRNIMHPLDPKDLTGTTRMHVAFCYGDRGCPGGYWAILAGDGNGGWTSRKCGATELAEISRVGSQVKFRQDATIVPGYGVVTGWHNGDEPAEDNVALWAAVHARRAAFYARQNGQ